MDRASRSPVRAPQPLVPCSRAVLISRPKDLPLWWRHRDRERNHLACPFRAPKTRYSNIPRPLAWAAMGLPLRGVGDSILSQTLRSPDATATGNRTRSSHPFRQTGNAWSRTANRSSAPIGKRRAPSRLKAAIQRRAEPVAPQAEVRRRSPVPALPGGDAAGTSAPRTVGWFRPAPHRPSERALGSHPERAAR